MSERGVLYRFSVFEVDPDAGVLRKRGVRVKLGGRPLDLLVLLIRHAGEVVSRETCRGRLWPAGTFVDFDHALNTLVNRLRDVLDDSATTPRFIETLPKRGYRFLAPVEVAFAAGSAITSAAERAGVRGTAEVEAAAPSAGAAPAWPETGGRGEAGGAAGAAQTWREEAAGREALARGAGRADEPAGGAARDSEAAWASGWPRDPAAKAAPAAEAAEVAPRPGEPAWPGHARPGLAVERPGTAGADTEAVPALLSPVPPAARLPSAVLPLPMSPRPAILPAASPVDVLASRRSARPPAGPGAAPATATSAGGTVGGTAGWPARAAIALLLLAVVVLGVSLWQRRLATRSASGKLMLAVLPFDNVGGHEDQAFFADGLTQEMIAALGGLEPDRLGVIARTTVMRYRETTKSAADIGHELAVDYLLEGSVRLAGRRVRVSAQLVETRTQNVLWSETYEQDVADVLRLQKDVASDVARSLALRILPTSVAARTPHQIPPEAYEAFLRGRYFREQATVSGARRAVAEFERATAIDPGFARAWAGLADAYRLLGAPGWEADEPAGLNRRAETLARRALALEPDLPDALAVLGMVRLNRWDLGGAEASLRRAIAINPNLAQAHQYLSSVLTAGGRFDEAIAAAERARVLDPLSPTVTATLGIRYLYARRYSEAVPPLKGTLDVTPEFAAAHWALGIVRRELGDETGAIGAMRRAVEHAGDSSYMRAWLAHTLAVSGRGTEARRIEAALTGEARSTYVSPFHFALVAVGLGERQRSLEWLERAYEHGSGWMVFLRVQREFDGLRTDPRFVSLLARVSARPRADRAPDTPAQAPAGTTTPPAAPPHQ
jgi:TolB-like protein/DNA-binding winged helix-turn-helix (wHTH) protein/tetratricopeptide (TPR) repeat protein